MDKKLRAKWDHYLNVRARSLWHKYANIFPQLAIFPAPTIKLCGRLKRFAGMNRPESNRITMAIIFFNTADNCENMEKIVLPHEIAHQIDYNINGWFKGKLHHGSTWVDVMHKIGEPPEIYHDMES